ncbi:MAG: transcription-repair coupling factor, partial [Deferribacteraceae bacterium]|nr:transcription-repair coupling factor [Deferribacteraceae bacterium]
MSQIIYSNTWGAAKAHFIAQTKVANTPTLVLATDQRQADLLCNELALFNKYKLEILPFPEYLHEPFDDVRIRPDISAQRSHTLKRILEGADAIIITTPYAIMKKLPPAESFIDSIVTLSIRQIIPQEELVELLDKLGYLPVEVVTGAGEFCLRGGIVDLFPITAKEPIRIEYFDDEIDLLFSYNVENQKKTANVERIELLPVSELLFTSKELSAMDLPDNIKENIDNFGKFAGHHWLVPLVYSKPAAFTDYISDSINIVMLEESWVGLFERLWVSIVDKSANSSIPNPTASFIDMPEIKRYFSTKKISIVTESASDEGAIPCKYRSVKARFAFEKGNLYYSLTQALKEIKLLQSEGLATVIAMESDRFTSLLNDFCRDHEIPLLEVGSVSQIIGAGLHLYRNRISGGFISEADKLVLITDEEIFGFIRRRSRPKQKDSFSTHISDLEEGDFVVHIDYGIGIYKGLHHMTMGDIEGDYLKIIYEGEEILYVPLERISQIQKYIGIGDAKPRLASLSSANWSKLKATARSHAAKIAQDLLKLYAER